MTGVERAGQAVTVKPKRHRWEHKHEHRKICLDCGLIADQRPHPYARRWWTEWTTPDGRSTNTLNGDKTPPCQSADLIHHDTQEQP